MPKCTTPKPQPPTSCERCGKSLKNDDAPPGGWELENGQVVCQRCAVNDTIATVKMLLIQLKGPS